MFNPYLDAALILFCYMVIWYIIAFAKADNSVADIAWGGGFILVVWWTTLYYRGGNISFLPLIVTAWGLRLAVYLFFRNRNQDGDWRYRKMKEGWGSRLAVKSFFRVFMLQGFLLYVIALPLMQIDIHSSGSAAYYVPGLGLCLFGLAYEALADYQLSRFKSRPENSGQIFQQGLWRYSRHPNYFGEILFWWGVFFLIQPQDGWYWLLISPLTITFLLYRVSGVPMLENKYRTHPEYQLYVKRTNAIIPKLLKH